MRLTTVKKRRSSLRKKLTTRKKVPGMKAMKTSSR
jgi:hypothetical protein